MTRSLSSNLYKSGWVTVQEEDKRVIDNNALLEQKLSAVLHAASIPDEEETEEAETENPGFWEKLTSLFKKS